MSNNASETSGLFDWRVVDHVSVCLLSMWMHQSRGPSPIKTSKQTNRQANRHLVAQSIRAFKKKCEQSQIRYTCFLGCVFELEASRAIRNGQRGLCSWRASQLTACQLVVFWCIKGHILLTEVGKVSLINYRHSWEVVLNCSIKWEDGLKHHLEGVCVLGFPTWQSYNRFWIFIGYENK